MADEIQNQVFPLQRQWPLVGLAILAAIGVFVVSTSWHSVEKVAATRPVNYGDHRIDIVPPVQTPSATPTPVPRVEPTSTLIPAGEESTPDDGSPRTPEPAPVAPSSAIPLGGELPAGGPGPGGPLWGKARIGRPGKWGDYALDVNTKIANALHDHPKTRRTKIGGLIARVWVDSAGRIFRAKLNGSTGDENLDRALVTEVLPGILLSEPPPKEMPMPIRLRISAG